MTACFSFAVVSIHASAYVSAVLWLYACIYIYIYIYRGSSILVRRLAVRHIYIQRHMLRAHVGNCRQPGCSRQQSPGHSCCCRRCKLPPSTRGSCRSGRVCSPTAATSAAVASGIAVACARQVTDTRPGVFGDNPCCPAPLLRSLW